MNVLVEEYQINQFVAPNIIIIGFRSPKSYLKVKNKKNTEFGKLIREKM